MESSIGNRKVRHLALTFLSVLLAIDADVTLRKESLERRCDALRKLSRFIQQQQQREIQEQEIREQTKKEEDSQTKHIQDSIEDAIRRARKIREEIINRKEEDDDADDDEEQCNEDEEGQCEREQHDAPRSLNGILAMARSIRSQESGPISASIQEADAPPRPLRTRLTLPRKLKNLLEELEQVRSIENGTVPSSKNNRVKESARLSFLTKSSEILSKHYPQKHTNALEQQLSVQVSYPKQVERLQQLYQSLQNYVQTHLDPNSEAIRKAIEDPSLPSIFPVYCRFKEVHKSLESLQQGTAAFAQRTPPHIPQLSAAAITHRDEMLKKLMKPQGTIDGSTRHAALRNDTLLTKLKDINVERSIGKQLEVMKKLQIAWDLQGKDQEALSHDGTATAANSSTSSSCSKSVYPSAVHQAILGEASEMILQLFKDTFHAESSSETTLPMEDIMRLVQLVDTIVVSNNRKRIRSVVRNTTEDQ